MGFAPHDARDWASLLAPIFAPILARTREICVELWGRCRERKKCESIPVVEGNIGPEGDRTVLGEGRIVLGEGRSNYEGNPVSIIAPCLVPMAYLRRVLEKM